MIVAASLGLNLSSCQAMKKPKPRKADAEICDRNLLESWLYEQAASDLDSEFSCCIILQSFLKLFLFDAGSERASESDIELSPGWVELVATEEEQGEEQG